MDCVSLGLTERNNQYTRICSCSSLHWRWKKIFFFSFSFLVKNNHDRAFWLTVIHDEIKFKCCLHSEENGTLFLLLLNFHSCYFAAWWVSVDSFIWDGEVWTTNHDRTLNLWACLQNEKLQNIFYFILLYFSRFYVILFALCAIEHTSFE